MPKTHFCESSPSLRGWTMTEPPALAGAVIAYFPAAPFLNVMWNTSLSKAVSVTVQTNLSLFPTTTSDSFNALRKVFVALLDWITNSALRSSTLLIRWNVHSSLEKRSRSICWPKTGSTSGPRPRDNAMSLSCCLMMARRLSVGRAIAGRPNAGSAQRRKLKKNLTSIRGYLKCRGRRCVGLGGGRVLKGCLDHVRASLCAYQRSNRHQGEGLRHNKGPSQPITQY